MATNLIFDILTGKWVSKSIVGNLTAKTGLNGTDGNDILTGTDRTIRSRAARGDDVIDAPQRQ